MVLLATSSTDPTLSGVPSVIVVAGPTAVGKSRLAVEIARAMDGIVINADSQQQYRDLPILSARPTLCDMTGIQHKLFGDLGPKDTSSAVEWADKAAREISDTVNRGKIPIVVGGTGLYLRALMEGLVDIPPVPREVRAAAVAILDDIGHAAFYERLKKRDPVIAQRISPSDTHRMIRAWEVAEATEMPLSNWQATPASPPVKAKYHSVVIMPQREVLYQACDDRFLEMVGKGAVEELRVFLESEGALDMPIMKMLGARELASHLSGEMSLNDAMAAAQTATRHFAKRQVTWFKNNFSTNCMIKMKYSENIKEEILPNIRRAVFT